jgi:hypothetical protein
MPETLVRHKGQLSFRMKADIWREVAPILAEELTCDDPEGSLTPDDIMMFFKQIEIGEACLYDLYFRVEAMTYPSRLDDIKDRTLRAKARIQRLYPNEKIGLWIKLSDGYWAETDEASTVRG